MDNSLGMIKHQPVICRLSFRLPILDHDSVLSMPKSVKIYPEGTALPSRAIYSTDIRCLRDRGTIMAL